ncbi:MAG TPA: tetratricopeptide repeat protein, partial [Kofleriaceae bacterium]|nr:tetratricopeptide repeat protein [Kofleriaceae bacterium]
MSLWSRIERRLTDFAGELLPDEFRLQIGQARELLGGGHPQEAAELLEAMLHERPDHGVALSLLGAARLELGQLDEARAAFGRALSSGDDLPEAFIGHGEATLALGDAAAAVDSFKAALRGAGGDRAMLHAAYRGLGMAWRALGDLDKAVRELRKAVAEQPQDPIALAALGEALVEDRDLSDDEAARLLERALEAGDAPPAAALALGKIALRERRAGDARNRFVQALEAAGKLPARAVERARAELA